MTRDANVFNDNRIIASPSVQRALGRINRGQRRNLSAAMPIPHNIPVLGSGTKGNDNAAPLPIQTLLTV
jgi:hypothetical protein